MERKAPITENAQTGKRTHLVSKLERVPEREARALTRVRIGDERTIYKPLTNDRFWEEQTFPGTLIRVCF